MITKYVTSLTFDKVPSQKYWQIIVTHTNRVNHINSKEREMVMHASAALQIIIYFKYQNQDKFTDYLVVVKRKCIYFFQRNESLFSIGFVFTETQPLQSNEYLFG